MNQVERCQHLTNYWKMVLEERRADVAEAEKLWQHWNNKLVIAQIAEKLAKESE